MKSFLITLAVMAAIVVATYAHCPTSFNPPPCIAQTFHWIERSVEGDFSNVISAGPERVNLGDLNPFRDTLFDSTGTVVIGKSQGLCIVVDFIDASTFTFQCTFGFYIGGFGGVPLSSLQLAGQFTQRNDTTSVDAQAITGGTGRFAGATGVDIQVTVPPSTPTGLYEYRHTVQLMTGFNCNCA